MTYANPTEKKIAVIHEQMATKGDFMNLSNGIAEDLHIKTSKIIQTVKDTGAKAFTKHAVATLAIIAVMLWAIVISSVVTYQLVQSISTINAQINQLNTDVNDLAIQCDTFVQETNARLDRIEARLNQLDADIALIKTKQAETAIVQPVPVIINYGDITHKSGLTAEQFDEVINAVLTKYNKSDTKLTGLGQALYDMETQYDINGFLALGVSGIESGWGRSNLAKNSNNLYGLLGMKFDSTYDCTIYFGKLMREHYIGEGRTSLTSISKKYCGGNTQWVSDVTWFIGIYTDMAKELYST